MSRDEYDYTTGTMATTLGAVNPLRYRGYVYDAETGLYYLQSRYYDPELGRFINADAYVSTGQGILGNNMFTYCMNSPTNGSDPCGTCFHRWDFWNDCEKCGGKTLTNKLEDFATMVADYRAMVQEDQRTQTELQLQLVKSLHEMQVRTEQLVAEQQRMQDILVVEFMVDRFSTYEKAANTFAVCAFILDEMAGATSGIPSLSTKIKVGAKICGALAILLAILGEE